MPIITILLAAAALALLVLWLRAGKQVTALQAGLDAGAAETRRVVAEAEARVTDIRLQADKQLEYERSQTDKRIAEVRDEAERRITEERCAAARHIEDLKKQFCDRQREEAEREAHFKAIAAEVLAAQSKNLNQNHEDRLNLLLKPLREELDGFRKTFKETYDEESRQRFSLDEHIKRLIETNNSIGTEARQLANALKGSSKVQGDWGEMILESILEKSGLTEGEEYTVQMTTDSDGNILTDDDGSRLRPDVVLHYPNQGDVVVDSKVSLKDYINYVNAATDAERDDALERHVRSVRSHIRELRDKRYQDHLGKKTARRSTDFVIMFIPNEPAYMAAMQADSSLWQDGIESRVLIVSPTHLVSVLSMIRQIWSENRQNRNALEIAESAGKMYDKFVGFVTDMEKIHKGIEATEKAYNDAMNKLKDGKGSLVSRADTMRALGAKATKKLNAPS